MNIGKGLTKYAILAAILLLAFLLPIFVTGQYFIHILIMVGINIILASSLRTIATTGQFSLAHAGFMAIGAYTSALLVMKLGFSFWVALPIAGLVAALIALSVGYLFIRVKLVYFAMLTMFTGQVIQLAFSEWKDVTGGNRGLINIPPPDAIVIPGILNIFFDSKVSYYYLILILVIICLAVLYRIDSSRIGKTFLAIQQGDHVAESVGVNVNNFKVFAWCVGCFFAGIAGSCFAHYSMVINPGNFSVLASIYIVIYMIVGGKKTFSGAIIGAFILTILPEVFRVLQAYQPLVFVGILFLIIFLMPNGLISLPKLVELQIKKLRGLANGNT